MSDLPESVLNIVPVPHQLPFRELRPEATLPRYATPGSACLDLFSADDAIIPAGNSSAIGTGLAVAIPQGHVLLIFSRSGMGAHHAIRLANCVGVVDSDYRGELICVLASDNPPGSLDYRVKQGDRIAQALLLRAPLVQPIWAAELPPSTRGTGGFGSTGT